MHDDPGFVEQALGVVSHIERERGQWVVFLEVSFWNKDAEDDDGRADYNPIKVVRRRISTYPTQERAELAASFMVRAAARNQPHPPLEY